jgi:3'-phosphoadenosine 5'-phosphosulfate sulfotransferase
MATTERTATTQAAVLPQERMTCTTCQERPRMPSRIRCSRCFAALPCNVAARARYRASARWRATNAAANRRKNPRRIHIGRQYHSMAESGEQARRIHAHIKERLIAFERFPAGT